MRFAALLFLLLAIPVGSVYARQPILEHHEKQFEIGADNREMYLNAQPAGNPGIAAFAIYGSLTSGDEVDLYYILAENEETVPIELLVPAGTRNRFFYPTLAVIGRGLPRDMSGELPFAAPLGSDVLLIPSPQDRHTTFQWLGLMSLYAGEETTLTMLPRAPYFLAVYDPAARGGDYVLRVGDHEDNSRSVRDTYVLVDPDTIVFGNSLDRNRTIAEGPSPAERAFFPKPQTPFQTLDSNLKLWGDYIGFFLHRLGFL